MTEKQKSVCLRFLRSLAAYLGSALLTWLAANYIELVERLVSDPQLAVLIVVVIGALIQAADKARRLRRET